MAQLAIKGHATRGREVIELLEMLGGKKTMEHCGSATSALYSIFNDGYIDYFNESHYNKNETEIFTLEEFLEKFPYKVGDKATVVRSKNTYIISQMIWNGIEVVYALSFNGNNTCWFSVNDLQPYKEETMEKKTDTSMAPILQSEDYSGRRFGYKIPKGYEFDCIKENEIIIKPIKLYTKTYEECCKILDISPHNSLCLNTHIDYDYVSSQEERMFDKISSLYRLLVCRDAYWKIAGDWKPDWSNDLSKYYISFYNNKLDKGIINYSNKILVFPTEEMRDAFHENFKELIEECKELL